MTVKLWTIKTPIAPWSIVADDGVVIASGFASPEVITDRLDLPDDVELVDRIAGVTDAAERFLAGDVSALDTIDVRQQGGPFQQQAWARMREIPAGTTWSYTELATKAGRPSAVRAAATACAKNRVAPFVPCHRVVRSDGSLGGYYYGLDVKTWLLDLERHVEVSGRTSSK